MTALARAEASRPRITPEKRNVKNARPSSVYTQAKRLKTRHSFSLISIARWVSEGSTFTPARR